MNLFDLRTCTRVLSSTKVCLARTNLKSLFGRQTKKDPYCVEADFSPVSDGIVSALSPTPPNGIYTCLLRLRMGASLTQKRSEHLDIYTYYLSICCLVPERVLFNLHVHKIYSDSVCSGYMFTRGCLQREKMPTILLKTLLVFLVTAFCTIFTFRAQCVVSNTQSII